MRNKLLSIMLSVTLILTVSASMGASVYAETAAEAPGAGESAAAERDVSEASEKPFAVELPNGISIISERIGKPVDPIDLSQYVSGGKAPYTYKKLSGPDWVKLSDDGVLSGTRPNAEYAAENMEIRISDSEGASKDITILADDVLVASDFIPAGVPNMEFSLTDIDGSKVSTLASGKPKIIFFFNTGCKRCRATVHDIRDFGMDMDKVDFIMSEASNGGVTEAQARKYYDECGIKSTARCYNSVDVCWEYLRACGYIEESTKKPIIVYISEDNEVVGYTWNYSSVYKCAQQAFGISLEPGEHHWTGSTNSGLEVSELDCAVCGIHSDKKAVDLPKPASTELAYNGKAQSILKDTAYCTVKGAKATAVGEYEAVVTLKENCEYTWCDGTTEAKRIKWSIRKGEQKPVVASASKSYRRSALKKRAQSFSLKVSGAAGAKTFEKVSGSSRLVLNGSTGKVTVRKGTPKGTYKMTVRVSCKATSGYEAAVSAQRTVTVIVR